ncbi:hypothetical protein HpV63gp4 [Human papillomavirus type 63]|uniref:Regulatory protein E2 n=1 Tax=Human papillomavirus type 63 TaxID=28311 RepID=VE2_HPV63|nr:hypothetical protein HpV63gp4 [Human papillomavirus type 63]Q07850.1 RecName: Full=Regulatory protein E2 [Human papillomavirus type 63]CAA50167.1 unnamed protein product [Human papillomavirus type 63]
MESLNNRLDWLQEQLLTLYEKDSKDIEDQIMQWNLLRQEQVLFHYARKKGIMRLGLQVVPSLAASQDKAKTAIEMTLYLSGLRDSQYGSEQWSLQDTSREIFLAPPDHTFKKGGQTIEVIYDEDPNNSTRHTVWRHIYYQNGDNRWRKAASDVDVHGVFYLEYDGVKNYYVDFQEEANRYSKTGRYTVQYEGKRFTNVMSPVNSSPLRTSGSPTDTNPATQGQSTQTARKAETKGSRHHPKSPAVRKRRPYGRRRSRSPRDTTLRRGEGESARASAGSGERVAFISPGDVGTSTRSPPKGGQSRLRRLIQEARDPPIICLKGGPNQLKCLRYRIKASNSSDFESISTTWHWVHNKCTDRVGHARMLVRFISTEQRDRFLDKVVVPKSVSVILGAFDGS